MTRGGRRAPTGPGRSGSGRAGAGTARRGGRALAAAGLLVAAATAGCGEAPAEPAVLVATTSVEDSGLLDSLSAAFARERPAHALRAVAVGSGEALELGRRGDADVLLLHAPEAEREFVREGHGRDRTPIMRNHFVIVGPPGDPARVRKTGSAVAALRTIAERRAPFVSRGDESGTHRREMDLWRAAGIEPSGGWYVEVGQGMGETLLFADAREAYTLSVSANYTVLRDRLRLRVLLADGPRLDNVYSLIRVTDPPHPRAADALFGWLASADAAAVIGEFGRDRYGEPLFLSLRGSAAPAAAGAGRSP